MIPVITGAVLSKTVTVIVSSLLLPDKSVTEILTVYVPGLVKSTADESTVILEETFPSTASIAITPSR